MDKPVRTVIDEDKCTGCGLCVKVCPSETLSIVDKKAKVTGDQSLRCGHCEAVCPEGAVTVTALDPEQLSFEHFSVPDGWIKHGDYPTDSLVHLMLSRRSCRNYSETPVNKSILEDLIKIGTTAPSGTNCQMWTFTVLPDRASVLKYGTSVLGYFKKLNAMAEKKWLRQLMSMAGKTELQEYYDGYYERVRDKIIEFETQGKDSLFHGAVSVIMIGSEPGASCPAEDALLATQNILLGAHAMGLGTCLIGFAVEAMKRDPSIKKRINVDAGEKIYSVIAIGHPAEKYQQYCGRSKVIPRFVTLG